MREQCHVGAIETISVILVKVLKEMASVKRKRERLVSKTHPGTNTAILDNLLQQGDPNDRKKTTKGDKAHSN